MPYIRDPDVARLNEILEGIKDFAEDENVKNRVNKALRILREYGGSEAK